MGFFNQVKTVLLLGALTGLLLFIGNLLGGMQGLTIAFLFSVLMNVGMYWFSDKIVLMMYRAREATKKDYPEYHAMIEDICKKAGLPKPKLYIVPSTTPNAFATGRSPKHAAVACTEGILQLLNKEELRGVLSHEMSHVKNRDILITTIAATIAGVISYVAMMARWAAIFGGMGGRDNNGRGNILGFLVIAILAPIIALILQLAISRSREYLADHTGAKLIKNPLPLADALQKLETANKHHPMKFGNPATSSLFIVNPFSGRALLQLFSTHPPLAERVRRLREMRV
ncbi:zinc metalloprotease HtpX [Candidatus Woesearchaeota archaeon]|nr:zinc metalloprotease HtpX [Candidatus Woesearchaeota archaeon]